MEFVVVVVLEDDEAVAGGERGKPRAPGGAHHGRGGKLVVRRDQHRADLLAGRERLQRADIEASGVERYRHEARASEPQCIPSRRIPEGLDCHHFAGTHQRASGEVDALHDPPGDQDEVGRESEATGPGEHRRQSCPERRMAAGIRVGQPGKDPRAEGIPESPRQRTRGEQARVGLCDQRQRSRLRRARREDERRAG